MIAYRTIALPESLAASVRATLASPGYGHPVHAEVATGSGPCRSCLQTFRTGEEERLLFTYNPFHGLDDYPAPGPVFIHREPCARHEEGAFPAALRYLPLMLEGYGRGRWLVARERTAGEPSAGPEGAAAVDAAVDRLFAHPAVDYIHVHNGEAGCYIARLERAGPLEAGTGESAANAG